MRPSIVRTLCLLSALTVSVPCMAQRIPEPPKAHVHMRGDFMTLERFNEAHDAWEGVCSTPCDQDLPLSWSYRVVGNRKTPSKPFHLMGEDGDYVTLNVEAGDADTVTSASRGLVLSSIWLVVGLTSTVASDVALNNASSDDGRRMMAGVSVVSVGVVAISALCFTLAATAFSENLHSTVTQGAER